eukprot:366490-Chlamydomonas_euryale.AAC.14
MVWVGGLTELTTCPMTPRVGMIQRGICVRMLNPERTGLRSPCGFHPDCCKSLVSTCGSKQSRTFVSACCLAADVLYAQIYICSLCCTSALPLPLPQILLAVLQVRPCRGRTVRVPLTTACRQDRPHLRGTSKPHAGPKAEKRRAQIGHFSPGE